MHTSQHTWRKALGLLAMTLAAVTSAFADVTFDSSASKASTNASSVTWSHTIGTGTNRVLLVGLATEDTSSSVLTVSAINYGGVAMTAVPSSAATAGSSTLDKTQLFYLLNPAAGTGTISVTFGGAVNGVSAGSVSLNGAAQVAPTATTTTATSANSISTNATVGTAGSWLVDVACSGASNSTLTPGTGQTKRWGVSQSSSGGASSTTAVSAAGTATSSWTASSSGQVALSVAMVTPSGTTTTVAPSITTQPTSQTVAVGGTVTLAVTASGTAPLAYQWKLGGAAISGATASSYTITNAQSVDAGSYTVTVSNSAGSITSSAAIVTVNATATAPTITTQPVSQTVAVGGTVTFSVAANGTSPLNYQWKLGGTAISGATSSSYTITNVQSTNAGSYTVTVSNSVGAVTSNTATLTVNITISGSAPVITTQPVSQSVSDTSNVTFSVVASGSSLSYQWQKNGTPISGAVSSTLTLTGVHATNAGAYTVMVSNSSGSDTSDVATLVTQPSIPTRTFNVTTFGAIGDGSTVNTTAIQNAINAAIAAGGGTVEIPAAAKAYMSDHLTLGSNLRLQVDSGATLQMLPPATYANAAVNFITAGDSSSGLTAHDVEIAGPGIIDGNGSTWWSLSTRPKMIHIDLTTTAQVKNITLTNSSKMHLMTLGSNNVTISGVTISAPSTSPNTDGIDPSGNDYIIQNCNVSVGDDDIVLKAETQSCSDILVNNCTIGTGHGVSIGAQTNLGVNGYRVTNCSFTGTDYVVRLKAQRGEGGLVTNVLFDHITFTGITKAPIYISSYYDSLPSNPSSDAAQPITSTSLTPQWQNIIIRNMSGTTVSSPSKGIGDIYGVPEAPIGPVLFDNVTVGGTTKTLTINHARDIQFVNHSSVALNTTTSTSLYDVGPIITTEPLSQSAAAGSNVTFSVVSVSATPQTYQWRRNGVAISGATSSSFTLNNAQSTNAGNYSVVITNSVKSGNASTTSDDAILTVN